MAGGSFTANLNINGLKLNVKNYKLKNNNINLDLYDAATSYENIDYTTSEENINTNLNTNDFDLGESISKASNQLQEIKSTQEEEKPWWDVVFDYAATAVGSVVSGVADVVENIGDGLIMCGGELASGVASLCGNEELASEIKKGTQDIVQYDWSEAAYDVAMDALDVDDEIAHGVVHQVGNAVGSMAGYAALSLVPGGAAVTAATGFLAAKGSSAEHAFQSGATFEEASVTSTVAGAAGALSGAALNKVQGAAKGASSIKDVAKLTAKGMAVSAAEPVVNSVTEYATYGKDMVDENGNLLYDNFGDYYVESGGLLNTAIASGVGGISTGSQAIKGYMNMDPKYRLKHASHNVTPRKERKVKIGDQEIKTNLTDNELIMFANDFYDLRPPISSLDAYPKYGVVEGVSSLVINEEGKLTIDWVENQGAQIGTRKNTVISAGSEIDRYGNPNGNFFGKMQLDKNGNYIGIDYDMRSLPYTEGSQIYTKMKVIKEISSDSLSKAMTALKVSDPKFYKEITIQMKKDGFPCIEMPNGTVKIEVNEAEIAAAYGHKGGGIQFELPIRSGYLKDPRLGFLSY